MAISNRQRVDEAFVALGEALRPYVEGELRGVHGEAWLQAWPTSEYAGGEPSLHDPAALLRAMLSNWKEAFVGRLSPKAYDYASELRKWRNDHAHHAPVDGGDALRVLDTARRLLDAVGATDEADRVRTFHADLQRETYEAQAKRASKQATRLLETEPVGALKPWREVVAPHPDVRQGTYEQAEFAADLWQVMHGRGRDEYVNADAFFARTFLTEGLRDLLRNALRRTAGRGGDPVVQLQVQFGGGKTHALLALWHLFGGNDPAGMAGIPELLKEEGLDAVPAARARALVGHKLTPGAPSVKEDGTRVRTLWGELAWELAGRAGYEIVREADETGTNPGRLLDDLFRLSGPCVILVDEWVTYARQMWDRKETLPGGDIEAQMSFAQALTEAARANEGVALYISLPESEREAGGAAGAAVLARLANVVGRQNLVWRSATTHETFEIVRRRLFEPITDAMAPHRDATVRAFADYYASKPKDFPVECPEPAYRKRLADTYPLHPALFDTLYNDWSSLERFQRTRGVLRLMAKVIHALWEGETAAPMILPGSVPIASSSVLPLLVNLLDDPWSPVVESDVDGESSVAFRLDVETPAFNPTKAAERAARSVFLYTAPHRGSAGGGADERRIRLGCAQPGEGAAVYTDALRRLMDRATYLYGEGDRYRFDTTPSLNRKAREYAEDMSADDLDTELRKRLDALVANRSFFAGAHACPDPGDVPDDRKLRLVVLGTQYTQRGNKGVGPAAERAAEIVARRGNSLRERQNRLVFLALDESRRSGIVEDARQWIAWRKICDMAGVLELPPSLVKQAEERRRKLDADLTTRLQAGYEWVLVPYQDTAGGAVEWQARKAAGDDVPAARAFKKLVNEAEVVRELSPGQLLEHIERWDLWEGEGVRIGALLEHYSKWLYLYRLENDEVLLKAVQGLLNQTDTEHGYADGYDASTGTYLRVKTRIELRTPAEGGYLVKPSVVRLAEESQIPEPVATSSGGLFEGVATDAGTMGYSRPASGVMVGAKSAPQRFHASKELDPFALETQMAEIAKQVVQHLMASPDAKVKVSLFIEGSDTGGFSEAVAGMVREQCKTLGFGEFGFESK